MKNSVTVTVTVTVTNSQFQNLINKSLSKTKLIRLLTLLHTRLPLEEKLKKTQSTEQPVFHLNQWNGGGKCNFFVILMHLPKNIIIIEWFMKILSVHLHL